MVNRYSTYAIDIRPKGFQAVEIEGYVTDAAVEETRALLADPRLREEMVEKNYALGRIYYSYEVLHDKLMNLLI